MNRTEFVVATAIILLVAFAMGWFTYWLLHRFTHVAGGDMGEMAADGGGHGPDDDRDRHPHRDGGDRARFVGARSRARSCVVAEQGGGDRVHGHIGRQPQARGDDRDDRGDGEHASSAAQNCGQ